MRLTTAQTDRDCGVVLGSAVGDALGAGYKFESTRIGPDCPQMIGGGLGNFAPGEWTDDLSMTWPVADTAAKGVDLRSPEALDACVAAQSRRPTVETRYAQLLGIEGGAVDEVVRALPAASLRVAFRDALSRFER